MYEQLGQQDIYYLLLYGSAATFALLAGLYLVFRRGNMFTTEITVPRETRWWAAALMAAIVMSHVWWTLLGNLWLADDRFLRNTICETLDFATLIPLMLALLIRMLQDRHRPVWPWFVPAVAAVAMTAVGIAWHSNVWETFIVMAGAVAVGVFIIYYVRAMKQYHHWLHENFVDLENKELWQSLLVLGCLIAMSATYAMNYGGVMVEYLTQVNTIIMVVFVTWRVERLQLMEKRAAADATTADGTTTAAKGGAAAISIPSNISELLAKHCEQTGLYLQHDLTLAQLAKAIGTNRTYLSTWFAQQDTTYNAYINKLRIDHFCQLYREKEAANRNDASDLTVQRVVIESGYHSYSTFSAAFKKIMGMNVSTWINRQG